MSDEWKFMKSRIHRKEPLQMFPAALKVTNFIHRLRSVDKNFTILDVTEIKAQTNFRSQFPQPHPRVYLESIVFWSDDRRMVGFGVILRNVEYNMPCVRYCLESFVTHDTPENSLFANGLYFGEESKLRPMINKPFTMWKWFLDPRTMNLTNQYGKPIGNLRDFLVDGTLTIRVELLVVVSTNVIARLTQDRQLLGETIRPKYVELIANRFRCPLEQLYKEFGSFTVTVYSNDRKSYFICHKSVLGDHSRVFRKMFKAKDVHGNPISSLMLENVSTESLRIILYFMYHKRVYDDWSKNSLDLLASCLNLEVDPLAKELFNDLRVGYGVSPLVMDSIWRLVHRYRQMVADKVKKLRRRAHTTQLHPGVPCGPMCRQ